MSAPAVSVSRPTSHVGLRVLRAAPHHSPTFWGLVRSVLRGLPSVRQSWAVNRWRLKNLPNLVSGVPKLLVAKAWGIPHFYGVLTMRVLRADGRVEELGVASHLLITTAGVNKIVDALTNVDVVTIKDWKYHAFGSGATAPANGDTALQTEYTTQYNPDNTRPTGSQVEGATANVYRTVGTFTPDAAVAVTEMGVLDQAATGGGDLLDRFTFSAVNLNGSGDALQTTVDVTFPAGS